MKFLKIIFPNSKYLIFAYKTDEAYKKIVKAYEGHDIQSLKNISIVFNGIVSDKTLLKFWKEDVSLIYLGYWSKDGINILFKPLDFYENIQGMEDADMLAIYYKE